QDYYKLSILGRILAVGESDNFIRFTSSTPEEFEIDHSTDGSWNGIRFEDTPATNGISKLEYCLIEYSKAVEENGIGGAVSVYDLSKLEITNCIFQNNVADYGSAIGCMMHSSPKIISSLFKDNYAFIGGSPFYCSYSYPRITNNTIVNNPVLNEETFYATGAVHTFISKPQITNNIFWDNENNYFANQQLLECKAYYTTYNDIEFGHDGKGNINEDPLFLYSANYPFYLQENSPCIDAANADTTGLLLPEFDIFGNPRIFDGDGNGETVVDMGAFEFIEGFINTDDNVISNPSIILYNYPNPFNISTTVYFTAKNEKDAEIVIYNIKGQKIRQFSIFPEQSQAPYGAGNIQSSIVWDGTDQH
ncbi:T9SS type A sorting domain-containing protein, partial [bacterium]|nr:T9SS type A sorting domain-containing protein [bacterium]